MKIYNLLNQTDNYEVLKRSSSSSNNIKRQKQLSIGSLFDYIFKKYSIELVFTSKEYFEMLPNSVKADYDFYVFEKFEEPRTKFITYHPFLSIDSVKMLGSTPNDFIAETIHTLANEKELKEGKNSIIIGMDKYLEILCVSDKVLAVFFRGTLIEKNLLDIILYNFNHDFLESFYEGQYEILHFSSEIS